ncbi:MAG: hypothetical protein H0T60_01735 [Acidobacteria bacterium]|nr:hypothetical protein [Acidobacteriota bacterium]
MLNGDAHLSSEVEVELRIRPVAEFSKIEHAHNTRPRATFHGVMSSHRILYAGTNYTLPGQLRDALKRLDCFVVFGPVDSARLLIASDIKYSLLLFDDDLAGAGLERFARALAHREQTPILLIKQAEGINSLVDTLMRLLGG